MVLGSEDWPYPSLIGGRTPRALGASTQRAVRRKLRSPNARPVLAGCSATKAEREASIPGEHAAGIRDERKASGGRGRVPNAIGPKNSLRNCLVGALTGCESSSPTHRVRDAWLKRGWREHVAHSFKGGVLSADVLLTAYLAASSAPICPIGDACSRAMLRDATR